MAPPSRPTAAAALVGTQRPAGLALLMARAHCQPFHRCPDHTRARHCDDRRGGRQRCRQRHARSHAPRCAPDRDSRRGRLAEAHSAQPRRSAPAAVRHLGRRVAGAATSPRPRSSCTPGTAGWGWRGRAGSPSGADHGSGQGQSQGHGRGDRSIAVRIASRAVEMSLHPLCLYGAQTRTGTSSTSRLAAALASAGPPRPRSAESGRSQPRSDCRLRCHHRVAGCPCDLASGTPRPE